jgi:hypothetical protein
MLQGGDPTGTGSGGDSYWGGTFKVFTYFFSYRQLFKIPEIKTQQSCKNSE